MRICVSVDLASVIEESSAVFRQVSHFVAPESQSTPTSCSYGSVPVQASSMQQSVSMSNAEVAKAHFRWWLLSLALWAFD